MHNPESVRGCLREADTRGPALPRDLHSVTAVTLSFLYPDLMRPAFQGLKGSGLLASVDLLLLSGALQFFGTAEPLTQLSRKLYFGMRREGSGLHPLLELGSTPYAYADTPASPPIPPSYFHKGLFSPSSCGH